MAVKTSRSLRRGLKPIKPLPYVPELMELYRAGTVFSEGSIVMVGGKRGSQKSGFAMWLARQWNVPTIYCNADMGSWVADNRHISLCTGWHKDRVSEALGSRDEELRAEMVAATDLSRIEFLNASEPSLDDIDEEIDAWVEKYDEFPSLIIIDNLMDMERISDQDYQNQIELLKQFKTLARETGALVLVLHHCKDDGDDRYPPKISAIQGKVSQTPELILTVALENLDAEYMPFRIATVKNRSGRAHPDASSWVELMARPDHTSFGPKNIYQQVAQSWQQ